MNSVFSAFKTSKSTISTNQHNEKNSKSSNAIGIVNGNSYNNGVGGNVTSTNCNVGSSSKKSILCNSNSNNENSYENLRHIREIGTSTKMMSSMIVNDDVEEDLRLHNRTIIKSVEDDDIIEFKQTIPKISSTPAILMHNSPESESIDEIDHIVELDSNNLELKLQEMKDEISQKRNDLLNGCNSSSSCSSSSTSSSSNSSNSFIQIDTKSQLMDNDEKQQPPPPKNSPAKSLTSYNNLSNAIASTSSLNDCFNGTFTTITSTLCTGKPPNNSTVPIIMGNKKQHQQQQQQQQHHHHHHHHQHQHQNGCSSGATTPKATRYTKPRLSLSGFNNSLPSIHGRPGSAGNNNNNNSQQNGSQPKRLSNHQRNLSLDFRSMGILLPPVSQVTNSRINLTQHHRNRSLDSALQRIPEVEVSSPNAETAGQTIENTFCTNSLNTMCSTKISNNVPLNQSDSVASPATVNSISKSNAAIELTSGQEIYLKEQQLQKSIPSSSATTIKSSSTVETNHPPNKVETNAANTNSTNKKREDLTSLGSDDSGIICGSESDQVSLNRIRHSHESLDSGEIDQDEQEIEILETTSMDEEYRMLQSDLCFYQKPEKDLHTLTRNRQRKIALVENCDDVEDETNNEEQTTPVTPQQDLSSCSSNSTTKSQETPKEQQCLQQQQQSKSEHIKNENTSFNKFNFFGATKNAIFRTAQSIIENHEKKSAAKSKSLSEEASNNSASSQDDMPSNTATIKSPTEFSKKKEFFMLKSCSNRNKVLNKPTEIKLEQSQSTENAQSPEMETKSLQKSHSISSINKLKVPGVVKCFIKSTPVEQMTNGNNSGDIAITAPNKTEKNQSGLLRFFESPVFNIHFAVHYLFYSKEPGVLSFIGNKIFSFPDSEVDLYIPQLIVMYIQMDELAEVLDPYLTIRCRKSVDFSLKCLWLLEAYNYQVEAGGTAKHLSLMKELFSRKERKSLRQAPIEMAQAAAEILSPIKKTHHRSQSDATGLMGKSTPLSLTAKVYSPASQAKLSLGDLTSGRAFDNGCICFQTVRGTVNDLLGQKTVCSCGAPKNSAQKEFLKALINVGKNLTTLQTKAEKTSALRIFLNLINKNLPARVWLPLHSDIAHHIVRITEDKTAVLNSKDKTPYIIYVEVVEVSDIYSSPVMMKMMPRNDKFLNPLRHTKSEENLESKDVSCSHPHHNHVVKKNSESSSGGGAENDEVNSFSKQEKLLISGFMEDDVWSQEDDEITAQYLNLKNKLCNERDTISQMSLDSCDSRDQGIPTLFNIGDVRTRHCNNLNCENTKPFSHDPEDPSAAALKEPWHEKERQIRESSPYGHLPNWRLLSTIVKCGDDLRQELMATQLLQMFKIIWEEENVGLWVRPYKIVCLSDDSGLIEPILNTVSLHQIKKNSNKGLRDYFIDEYGGDSSGESFKQAQKNFVQSCAAYCLISYLLQVKDRHNGNILLHSDGHIIHIDFGFILSISPKNLGFEQSPFKLTHEFVDVMGGTQSPHWSEFNHLLLKGLMAARKHMDRIINLVEIMRSNAQLPCFKNGCSGTVQNLRKRFHMNLTEQELERKVDQLVQDSLKSLSTKLYDGYQYFTNGIL